MDQTYMKEQPVLKLIVSMALPMVISMMVSSLPGVEQLHLLPYHRLGQDKYIGLGRPYLMEGILPPTAEHMQMLKNAVHAVCGLDCQIGG